MVYLLNGSLACWERGQSWERTQEDDGIKHFLTDSEGIQIENPRFHERAHEGMGFLHIIKEEERIEEQGEDKS